MITGSPERTLNVVDNPFLKKTRVQIRLRANDRSVAIQIHLKTRARMPEWKNEANELDKFGLEPHDDHKLITWRSDRGSQQLID